MNKTRLIVLAILIALLIFLPKKANGDIELSPPEEPALRQPIEVIGIPSKVKPENDAYYLMAYDEFKTEPVMLKVGMAESSFDPEADNIESTADGLYQIIDSTWNGYHCTGTKKNAEDNIACARKIYDDSGTTPWLSSSSSWKDAK